MLSRRDFILLAIAIGLITFGVWLDLTVPEYLGRITNLITGATEDGTRRAVWTNGLRMLGFAVGSVIVGVIVALLSSKISASHAARLRKEMFKKVGEFSQHEMNKFSVASLITRTTNDINNIQQFTAMAIQGIIGSPILAIWAMTRIAGASWQLSLVTGASVMAMVILLVIIMLVAMPRFFRIQTLTDRVNQVSRENLTGLRVVRAYNAEEFEQEKFDKANVVLTKNNIVVERAVSIFMPFLSFLLSVMTILIYLVTSRLISSGEMPLEFLGDMMVFSQYSVLIVFSLIMVLMTIAFLPRTIVSARRVYEVLSAESTVTDGTSTLLGTGDRDIEFKNVSFKYPNAENNIVTDVSLQIKKGQTVAFIGSTGSGKSTLVNLLPRIYDATEGEITIGGTCVRNISLTELNTVIGYVPQTAVIFKGTIRSNIDFGKGKDRLTDDAIWMALEIAQAKDFVEKLDGGLDAEVAQAGKNLSGGQKQRLAIARVIARSPEIFIFDDTFSALDYKTDKKLRNALKQKTENATKLIVAQRIGTIKDADQIFVLDKDKIVGKGTHDELMKSNEIYREIALSQLSKEEL